MINIRLRMPENRRFASLFQKVSPLCQGRVIASFTVEKDGSLTDIKIVKSVDPSLDKEAQRVIRAMPRWIPGKVNGSPVRVKYTVPLTFRLQ